MEKEKFLKVATVNELKRVLRLLEEQTSGSKATLKLRLEEKFNGMDEDEIVNILKDFNGDADYDEGAANDETEEDFLQNGELENGAGTSTRGSDEQSSRNNCEIVNNLNEEIVQLKRIKEKKLEIAKLRKEIAALCESGNDKNVKTNYTFRDIEDSIPTFSGDDNFSIQKWIEIFEENIENYQWDHRMSFLYAKRLLSGTAKLYLRTIACKTWPELKSELLKEFQKRVTTADIHNQLRQRKKNRHETLQQYVLTMQEIASFTNIDEADLIRYIILGIPDSNLNKIILYSAKNMADFKNALHTYEKLKTDQMNNDYTRVKHHESITNQNVHKFKGHENSVKCFNCNELGHVRAKCNKPQRVKGSCFKCGQQGHFSRNCTKQQNSSVMIVNDGPEPAIESASKSFDELNTNDFECLLRYEFGNDDMQKPISIHLVTILDSGSPISFIQQGFIPSKFVQPIASTKSRFHGLNNSPLDVLGKMNCVVNFQGKNYKIELLIVNDNCMNYPVVLGRDFLKLCNFKFVSDENNVNITHVINSNERKINDINFEILNIDVSNQEDDTINLFINDELHFDIQKNIKKIVLDKNNLLEPNNIDFEMKIRLSKEEVFNCAPRKLPFAHKIELQKIIDDLLKRGVIRESSSEYASPIVLVKKKSGDLRLCVDFRDLNRITLKDNYPLPLIEDHLDRLKGKKYFSLLDLRNGFYHVKVHDESIKYTSFVTPLGQYEFLRMPFGLKNAPAVFQRFINMLFKPLISEGKLSIYIDDILIASESLNEHIDTLKEVMEKINTYKLELRHDKCKFCYTKIVYLGYEISVDGIRPTDSGIQAIKSFPPPRNVKEVQSFLGLCQYFRKFIKNFALIAKPLYDLVKKDVDFRFGQDELQSFENLKTKLQESPVLSIFSPNLETELHCDASCYGYGAVLLQKQEDKQFHPVFFFSKRTTEAERKYHSYELETLAVIYALRRFRVYLVGINFKIVTDCQALTQTLKKKIINPRISRWALELQDYNYCIEHRRSEKMLHVDALSRNNNILIVENDSFENALISAQNRDSAIRNIAELLEKRESPLYDMINGVVYRKFKNDVLFYVPKQMERNVIQTHHETLCHVGVEKCYDFLRKMYWFPQMKAKIKEYISTCLKCLHFSPPTGKTEATLHNIPKGKVPFEVIHIDHLGPLPCTKNRKKYIFAIVDGFTKFIKLYAVRNTTTKECINCLKTYFVNYSRPRKIISDRGSCFTSDEFSKFCSESHIQHIKIATSSPQSNGQIERFNRTIIPMLSKGKMINSDVGDWSKYLHQVEYAINNVKNKSTDATPSMLLFGVQQRGEVVDKILEFMSEVEKNDDRNLGQVREKANKNIEASQRYNKEYFDSKHRVPRSYNVGDYVLIKNVVTVSGVNKKLVQKYKGPYTVVKVLPNDRYVIEDIKGMQISRVPYHGVCSVGNMKPYCFNKD